MWEEQDGGGWWQCGTEVGDGKQFSRKNGSLCIIKILSLTSENKTRQLRESDLVTVRFHSPVSYGLHEDGAEVRKEGKHLLSPAAETDQESEGVTRNCNNVRVTNL